MSRFHLGVQTVEHSCRGQVPGIERFHPRLRDLRRIAAWGESLHCDHRIIMPVVFIHLGLHRVGYPGQHHPDQDGAASAAMHDACGDRKIDRRVRDIAGAAIERSAQFRHLSGHARELTIGGIDDAVQNQQGESVEPETFIVEHGAARDADQGAENGHLRGSQPKRRGEAGDDEAERTKEVNVDQLLDFVGFESETLRKNRLAVSRRHKAVASTQILRGCKSRSGGLQPPFWQAGG